MTSRRLCRALACPRHVDRNILFCNVHWPLLPLKLQRPIANNREASVNAGGDAQRAVASGVADAVAFLAGKEGRKRDLNQAVKSNSVAPGQGGTTPTGETNTGSGGSPGGTPVYTPPGGGLPF